MSQNARMTDITVREAEDSDLPAVAALRWQWAVRENGAAPATTRDEFVECFVTWARQHATGHRCVVALRGHAVVGMAWLAITLRVPTPTAPHRTSGDVQCVYVVPAERDSGVGGRLIDGVLDTAWALGLERVTVHSSSRAVAAYARHGFAASPRLLQADLAERQGR